MALVIDLDAQEKMNNYFRTGVVCVFWKKVGGLFRIYVNILKNTAR